MTLVVAKHPAEWQRKEQGAEEQVPAGDQEQLDLITQLSTWLPSDLLRLARDLLRLVLGLIGNRLLRGSGLAGRRREVPT
jgi:hypothetical protein